jgi:hypothetical protein
MNYLFKVIEVSKILFNGILIFQFGKMGYIMFHKGSALFENI